MEDSGAGDSAHQNVTTSLHQILQGCPWTPTVCDRLFTGFPKSIDFFCYLCGLRKWSLLCTAYLVELREIGRAGTKYKARQKDSSTRGNTRVLLTWINSDLSFLENKIVSITMYIFLVSLKERMRIQGIFESSNPADITKKGLSCGWNNPKSWQ